MTELMCCSVTEMKQNIPLKNLGFVAKQVVKNVQKEVKTILRVDKQEKSHPKNLKFLLGFLNSD